MDRRHAVKMLATASALTLFPSVGFATLNKPSTKLIWVILRGAQDGLSTLIPHNEPLLAEYRPTLWPKLKPHILKLNNDVSLHPELTFFKELFDENQLIAIPAVSTGYEGRSHFEGQDYMEYAPKGMNNLSGWVGRLLKLWARQGLAVSPNQPACMRGSRLATNWYPSQLKHLNEATYAEILDFYKKDDKLHSNLNQALNLRNASNSLEKGGRQSFSTLCDSCGKLMGSNSEYSFATLELGGWDTHSNQHERLIKQMRVLNNGVKQLKSSLNNEWLNTSVIISTEFGRTVKENGTGGTDHGTASALFLTGGYVKQSKIIGNWPNLEKDNLFEQRDVLPQTNFFESIKFIIEKSTQLSKDKVHSIFFEV